jgi:hypothetical protein
VASARSDPDAGGPPTDGADGGRRFYYLRNFRCALDWVRHRYDDLLHQEEKDFIAGFDRLPPVSQALLVRMIMRKGTMFRTSALQYDEIGCPLAACAPLVRAGWVDDQPSLMLDDAARLLRRHEIAALAPLAAKAWKSTKGQLVEALQAAYPQARPWTSWLAGATDLVLEVLAAPVAQRIRLMFFGNLRQEWSEFVLADLGIFRYEQVEFSRESRAFASREEVDACLRLHGLRQRLEDAGALEDVLAEAMAETCAAPWVRSRRDKLVFEIARQLEREQRWEAALLAYRGCGHPEARHRAMRVLEQTGRHAAALDAAQQAMAVPCSDAETQRLQRMIPRLRRAIGLPRAAPAPARLHAAVAVMTLARPRVPQPVEESARLALETADAPAFYVENTLITALFGLLCWRTLFMPVPGAFFHPFQRGPADLYWPEFVQARSGQFEGCLRQLDDGSYRETILDNFRAKAGLLSPFVHWAALDIRLVELALHCMPASHLKLWFRRILADIRGNTTGLPDLVQFWPAERRYELIEVKGPGDRLQDNQRRWMAYNLAHGIPVKVCQVRWAD